MQIRLVADFGRWLAKRRIQVQEITASCSGRTFAREHGIDRTVIALWLGHESVETAQIYLEANLAMKEGILAKTTPPNGKPGRYRPGDGLLTLLKNH